VIWYDSPFAAKPLNLEQLRKQARELLKGWQAGDEMPRPAQAER